MKMKRTTIILAIAILFSCTPQRKINKLEGHSLTYMLNELGKPTEIIPGKADSTYIYVKEKDLRSTEISKAAMTLDPMVTPEAHKTDKYIFTIKNGIVVNSKHDIEYKRIGNKNPNVKEGTGIKINN